MAEERKLVTVIFADIVGSTRLGESNDPEVIRATLSRAFGALSEILEEHGGTVEKYIGDAVMAVFGVPHAHDDDAERAVRAAFALRIRLSELNARGGPQLALRIGIDSGEAVAGTGQGGQHLVTGSVVNAAARLQTSAAPGQIRVGSLTRRLTGGAVRYAEVTTIDAKGFGEVESWPAVELMSALPEPQHGIVGLRAPLIGRDRELRQLLDVYGEVAGSESARLVTVVGPPGSGKSRLAAEFLAAIGTDRVRAGRCLPYGRGITYYAIQLIVRADAGIDIGDPLQSAIAKVHTATRRAFSDAPEDADAVARRVAVLAGLARAEDVLPEVAATQLREELSSGLRRYLERRAATSPLVLVFEDIHWAESGLLELIAYLTEWSRAPLLLLCLARPEFRESAPTWGSGLANATTLALSPLTGGETRELITALLAVDALPETLRAEVVDRAEGNPLFVEEFLRMLMETGRIEKRDGRWLAVPGSVVVGVPPTLQGLITARLDLVSGDLKQLLQRGSLAGRLFSTAALEALGDGSPPDLALMREAVRRDLLVEVDERAIGSGQVFRFKHVLIRDVAYSTVPKGERSRLHDRYGRWLEKSLGDRSIEVGEIVAYHAQQAYRFARELDAPATQTLGRRALDLLFAAAWNALDRDDAAALDLYERANTVATAIGATPAELAEANGYVVVLRRQLATEQRPVAELDDAIAVARVPGPSRVLVDLLIPRAFEAHRFGGSGMPFATEALAVARATGDPELVAEAMWTQLEVVYLDGDLARMQRLLAEALAYVKATGAQRARDRIFIWGSRLARYRGDLSQAAVYRDESVAVSSGSKANRGIAALGDCRFALAVGDVPAAVALGREALALMREVGLPHFVGLCCLTLGDALLADGDAAAARDLLMEGLDIFVRRRQRRQIPELAARAARACVRLGVIAEARTHAQNALATALATDAESRYIAAVALAEVSEAEGDLAAADAGFREALAILAPTGIMDAQAFVRETYAEFLLRQGRGADARAELEAARTFHHDPLAFRNRERIDALIARSLSGSAA
jgi:class 3 adenylate cyclase